MCARIARGDMMGVNFVSAAGDADKKRAPTSRRSQSAEGEPLSPVPEFLQSPERRLRGARKRDPPGLIVDLQRLVRDGDEMAADA